MCEDLALEERRRAFFERARQTIGSKTPSGFSETELQELWPGPNGRFNIEKAHEAFQRENLHWEWLNLP